MSSFLCSRIACDFVSSQFSLCSRSETIINDQKRSFPTIHDHSRPFTNKTIKTSQWTFFRVLETRNECLRVILFVDMEVRRCSWVRSARLSLLVSIFTHEQMTYEHGSKTIEYERSNRKNRCVRTYSNKLILISGAYLPFSK